MGRGRIGLLLGAVFFLFSDKACPAEPLAPGFHPGVKVSAPTRLDWTFAVSNRSLVRPPEKWKTADHDSKKQTYDLYVPKRKDRKTPLPLVLFISAGKNAGAGKAFAQVCQTQGFFYAAPINAGNDCPGPKRMRIVLDVLDDVRRHYPIDPDRTYVSGFSGGGRIACHLAFALPELFGGIAPVCAGEFPREESWLRCRVAERLSVALVTGEKDYNRGELERLRGPLLKDVGVRTRVWTVAGMGHGMPAASTLGEVVRWLEDALPRRQALAKKYPASSLRTSDGSERESLAKALLDEGRKRLQSKETLYSGLMQIKGVLERWPDLGSAREAQKLLDEYDAKPEKPWEADDLAEQRLFLAAKARALDGYASGPLPPTYAKMRADMAESALKLWQRVLDDNPDSPAGKEAKKRIPELQKLAPKE